MDTSNIPDYLGYVSAEKYRGHSRIPLVIRLLEKKPNETLSRTRTRAGARARARARLAFRVSGQDSGGEGFSAVPSRLSQAAASAVPGGQRVWADSQPAEAELRHAQATHQSSGLLRPPFSQGRAFLTFSVLIKKSLKN